MSAGLEIVEADLSHASHREAVLALTDAYAQDPMGDGGPLEDGARGRLLAGLQKHPTTLIFLAHVDGVPVGIATCFGGFSTFAARPLVNIHDLAVLPEHRGRGIGRALLQAVEAKARETGCCRITLEVRQDNLRAKRAYEAFGFGPVSDGEASAPPGFLFLSKTLKEQDAGSSR